MPSPRNPTEWQNLPFVGFAAYDLSMKQVEIISHDHSGHFPRSKKRSEKIKKSKEAKSDSLADGSSLGSISPETLAKDFAEIRSYLAANAEGMTRDETLVAELAKILLTKAHDERSSEASGKSQIFGALKDNSRVGETVRRLWKQTQKEADLKDFGEIVLDDQALTYVIRKLQAYQISDSKRDTLGEVFEALIGPSLRGGQGQFFTPKNVVHAAIRMLDPGPSDRIIDPACGSGGFIIEAAKHIRSKKGNLGVRNIGGVVGVDKDSFLASLARSQLLLLGAKPLVYCQNSLAAPMTWNRDAIKEAALGTFDFVVTNPPFGAQIPVTGVDVLSQYDLARKWIKKSETDWHQSSTLLDSRPPQILFIERCWALLKEGGICAIVLPEGILGNVNDGYVREWLRKRAEILAIIDCPLETFMPSTSTKTSVLVFKRTIKPKPNKIFIAVADNCGHDRRGNPTFGENGEVSDDFSGIAEAFLKFRKG